MSKRPFTVRELLLKLKKYGVIQTLTRGKGSEIVLLQPIKKGSKQGPQYSMKDHGPGTEISIPVIKALLRRFSIDESEFWGESKRK